MHLEVTDRRICHCFLLFLSHCGIVFYFVLERQTCVSCSKVSDPVQCSHSVVCDTNEVKNVIRRRF